MCVPLKEKISLKKINPLISTGYSFCECLDLQLHLLLSSFGHFLISTLSGKIGALNGVTCKATYTNL
jgi:hypothetical protein